MPPDIEIPPTILKEPQSPIAPQGWELDMLLREVILNSSESSTGDLRRWAQLANIVNALRNFENELDGELLFEYDGRGLLQLYRIAHRQFEWQIPLSLHLMARYYKIFSDAAVEQLVIQRYGIDSLTLYRVGLACCGIFLDRAIAPMPITNSLKAISAGTAEDVLRRLRVSLSDLQVRIGSEQSYDIDYFYTFNPLRLHPLIDMTIEGRPYLVCPVPDYLFRRITEGIYFDIVTQNGFASAFGDSFQKYVGEALQRAARGRLYVLSETTYGSAKAKKRTVDWITGDDTADLFIECKTKRVRYAAKIALSDIALLEEGIAVMAAAVVQIYKTLQDALAGHYPQWKPRGLPIFPLVVTLEEWSLFNHQLIAMLDEQVQEVMRKTNMPLTLLNDYPFSICSVDELEQAAQVQSMVGVAPVMQARLQGEHRLWLLKSVLQKSFPDALANCQGNLFPEVDATITGPVA